MNLNNNVNQNTVLTSIYCLVSIYICCISCQKHNAPISLYNKVYGGKKDDLSSSIAYTKDGCFVVAGTTSSNNGDVSGNHGYADVWLIKADAGGKILWQKTYGGSQNDFAFSVVATSDGGYAIAGSTDSNDGDVKDNHSANSDVWVIKVDSTGKLIWQRTFGGSEADGARAITETTDGGLAIAGFTNSMDGDVKTSYGSTDAWILKLSGVGNLLWQLSLGGAGADYANSITALPDGGIVMAGQTKGTSVDMYIAKIDENGKNVTSANRTIGGSKYDNAASIVSTPDSGFLIVGNTFSHDGNIDTAYDLTGLTGDVCVAKLNRNFRIVWVKIFGGSGDDLASSVINTKTGGYLIAGQTRSINGDITISRGGSDAWVLKIGSKGDKQWQQSIGGSGTDLAYGLVEIPRRGYVVTGSSTSNDGDILFNHGEYDIFVATIRGEY